MRDLDYHNGSSTRAVTTKGKGGAGSGPSTGGHGKDGAQHGPSDKNPGPSNDRVQPDPPKKS